MSKNPAESSFFKWKELLNVAHTQVQRSADSEKEGECALAIVATSVMLEAYLNLHAKDNIPSNLIDAFDRLNYKSKFLLAPRFAGVSKQAYELYETSALHKSIEKLSSLRNKIAHGNLSKWEPDVTTPSLVTELWNSALDLLIALETSGFRLPSSVICKFREEADSMKIMPKNLPGGRILGTLQ